MANQTTIAVLAIISANSDPEECLEAIDACFAAAIFDINVDVLFIGNNIHALVDTNCLDPKTGKNLAKQWASAELYDIDNLWVLISDLSGQAITSEQLISQAQVINQAPKLGHYDHIMSL